MYSTAMQTSPTSCCKQADFQIICVTVAFLSIGVALMAIALASQFPSIQRHIGVISSPIALGGAGLIIGLAGIGGCCHPGMPLEKCRS